MSRKHTKAVKIGSVTLGGGAPVVIQSMTNTDTRNVNETLQQIEALARAGCEVVRVAVLDQDAAYAIKEITTQSVLPVIADIHFDYRLALIAIEQGIHGLRLNPGNIGARWKVQEVVHAVKEREIPIRIGVNAGSLEKEICEKYQGVTAEGMVESALKYV